MKDLKFKKKALQRLMQWADAELVDELKQRKGKLAPKAVEAVIVEEQTPDESSHEEEMDENSEVEEVDPCEEEAEEDTPESEEDEKKKKLKQLFENM